MAEQHRTPRNRDESADIADFAAKIKEMADEIGSKKISRGEAKLVMRSMRELIDSFTALAPYVDRRKVTVFGSARTPIDSPLYKLAVNFGARAAEENYMVVTGAGPGIMEAAHVGAGRDHSIGLNIELPFEQMPNKVIEGDPKLLTFNYFFTRKLLFLKEADALVLFPGGFGTMDEAFEALTLIQTGKAGTIPIVMIDEPGGEYWHKWIEYISNELLNARLISEEDERFFRVTYSVGEAISEIKDFYRIYHSQRYVGKDLVLRLNKPIPDALLERIRIEFQGLLAPGGEIRQGPAHMHEANEPGLADKTRLFIRFNRKSTGKLRELIDLINREVR